MGENQEKQRKLEQAVDEYAERQSSYHAYTEDEVFSYNGEELFTVLDYWRLCHSALASDHDRIAEFLVYKALGKQKAENVAFWTSYDLSYRSKRIEVKATTYVHPWNKKTSKQRVFSIAPTNNYYWFGRPDRNGDAEARQNDLYVFCINMNQDIENHDPLRVDDWDFYVVPTYKINAHCSKSQKTISLGVVKRLAGEAVKWPELKDKVDEVIADVDRHIAELDQE